MATVPRINFGGRAVLLFSVPVMAKANPTAKPHPPATPEPWRPAPHLAHRHMSDDHFMKVLYGQ